MIIGYHIIWLNTSGYFLHPHYPLIEYELIFIINRENTSQISCLFDITNHCPNIGDIPGILILLEPYTVRFNQILYCQELFSEWIQLPYLFSLSALPYRRLMVIYSSSLPPQHWESWVCTLPDNRQSPWPCWHAQIFWEIAGHKVLVI